MAGRHKAPVRILAGGNDQEPGPGIGGHPLLPNLELRWKSDS
jgi:hypothetical protein